MSPGEVVARLGPSGSGKTALLNVIACILDPSEGTMSLEGELVFDQKWLRHDLGRLRLDKIGFIFQACPDPRQHPGRQAAIRGNQ